MRFYTQQHQFYCGIDLHARSMYVCILDQAGTVVVHKNVRATPEDFLRVIAPYREDLATLQLISKLNPTEDFDHCDLGATF